jgi:Zn-dependent M28 family amino/carboxypeptidase
MISGNEGIVRAGTLGWVLLVYPIVPSTIYAIFYARGRKNGGSVPGAADNLSACALVVAMGKFLVENPCYIPDEMEIRLITFGSEEAGVRGSRRYVERHLAELKRLDARLLNYETIAHPEISILSTETNGTVKNSPEMVMSVAAAAQRAGVPFRIRPATLGTGSDAGPFSRREIKATTLLGFNLQQMVAFYHQKRDTPEVLTIEPLQNVLKLTLEWVRNGGEQVEQLSERLA